MGLFSKFKKRKKDQPSESAPAMPTFPTPTYKERVETFWQWYSSVAQDFYDTIEAGNCGDLAAELNPKIEELLPGMAWVFGPGENDEGHSLTLSPEGYEPKQFLTTYWMERAPKLEGWTFYDARQAGGLESVSISMNDVTYDAQSLWLTPGLDEDRQKIDITVWHPKFEHLDKSHQLQLLFIWLDHAIGEKGVRTWIGEIEIGQERLKEAIPISDLLEFTEELREKKEWNTQETIAKIYELEPQEGPLRADSFMGTTICFSVISDYFRDFQPIEEDPVPDLGAHYMFLSIDRRNMPDEDLLEFRYKIDDAIEEALKGQQAGKTLGGGTGLNNAYIDLLIFDGQNSIDLITEAVAQFNLEYPVAIHPFHQSFRHSITL